ncbi:type I-E CRISPR-associated protein Cse1/CasA [Streptomyces silvensis]|uniref:Type I-E CRISPR-associated protein Cse1/CasA n=1 Tax=Streptomyces silvensis TaxID=1765722 RepID=A0A0W7X3C8_9ACTN|nr:type I-E CRISPR-associated protein Cse1/CasA [Streptomyces silvensis]KUF17372.1 hypothetical protein AT728_16355 [Streptomyces silvensis]
MPVASFPLTTSPWIPVLDQGAHGQREVGLLEALAGAHRLSLAHTSSAQGLVLLRLLAAVFDAACGPRTETEWDKAWTAQTLDVPAITAYLERWEERLDLFHPEQPALQSGALTAFPRGPEVLHPGSVSGASGRWFHPELRCEEPLAPYPAPEAARLLLRLLAFDVAGIKRAAPGDPAARRGKLYGAQIGPLAAVTHLHLTTPGGHLKDMILLSLPPQPRAAGDAPVWERDTPPAPVRTRPATGRLDLLTWPNRRIRLHATGQGEVDAVALHDGDRLQDGWETVHRLDPMTAWTTTAKRKQAPLDFLNAAHWPVPWQAARLLDASADLPRTSGAVDHAIAAAERGTLPAALPLHAALSRTRHSNAHKSVISDIPVETLPLGTAGQLADPGARQDLAAMARRADRLDDRLRKVTAALTGLPGDLVASRMYLSDLDRAWENAVRTHAANPEQARTAWRGELRRAADLKIDAFPVRTPLEREKVRAVVHQPTPRRAAAPAPARPKPRDEAAAGRQKRGGGPKAPAYEAFGGRYTLSQIARLPQCVVTYTTLRTRVVEQGWNVEEAATTAGTRGPGRAQQH